MFETMVISPVILPLSDQRRKGAELVQKTRHALQSLAAGPTIAWLHQQIQPTPLMNKNGGPLQCQVPRRTYQWWHIVAWWRDCLSQWCFHGIHIGILQSLSTTLVIFPHGISFYRGFLKWGYPQIIYLNGIFPSKPSIFGHPHLWNPPFDDTCHLAPADPSSPLPKKPLGWRDPQGLDSRVFVVMCNVSKAISIKHHHMYQKWPV